MSRAMVLLLRDDLDPGISGTQEEIETVGFSFEGTAYELDLCQENLQRFRDAMLPWVTAASQVDENGDRVLRKRKAGKPRVSRELGIRLRAFAASQDPPIEVLKSGHQYVYSAELIERFCRSRGVDRLEDLNYA
jgi:hypothetical protein